MDDKAIIHSSSRECLLNAGAWMTHDERGDDNGDEGPVLVGRHHLFRGPDGSYDGVDSIERGRGAADGAGGDGDMAMDMARLAGSADLDLEFAEAAQPQQQHCEAQDESTTAATSAGEQFEALDAVVGCLDFDAAVSGISCEDESKGLENLELQEFGELLQEEEAGGEGVVNSAAVGEEEALLLAEAAKGDGCVSVSDSGECSSGERKENVSPKKAASAPGGAKKKAKVDWTPELHRRFVHAVEQLGVEKAFPSRILELMGVQCLTRHNIASHLQKYRSHRRHLAAREAEAASWTHRRAYTHTPWARPSRRDGLPYLVPLHAPHIQPRPLPQPLSAPLKVWGYPTVDHSNVHMWQQPPPPSYWQAPDGSYWQHPAASYGAPYPHPMRVAPAIAPMVAPGFPDDASGAMSFYSDFDSMYLCNQTYDADLGRAAGVAACSKPPETHLSKEVLDAAIGEALANPWTPPPLGLKPPSMEGVIAELQRQGINTVPPSTC